MLPSLVDGLKSTVQKSPALGNKLTPLGEGFVAKGLRMLDPLVDGFRSTVPKSPALGNILPPLAERFTDGMPRSL